MACWADTGEFIQAAINPQYTCRATLRCVYASAYPVWGFCYTEVPKHTDLGIATYGAHLSDQSGCTLHPDVQLHTFVTIHVQLVHLSLYNYCYLPEGICGMSASVGANGVFLPTTNLT